MCLAIAFAICISGTLSAQPPTKASKVVLANDIVRFEFEPEYMGLIGMTDLATGVNHIQSTDQKSAPGTDLLPRHRKTQHLKHTDALRLSQD